MNLLSKIMFKIMPMEKYPEYLKKQGVKIGEKCEIYKTASFGSEPYLIELGNHVRINANVTFSTHDGGCWVLRDPASGYGDKYKNADCFGKIVIEDNVHVAHGVTILPNVRIGKNSIIGCGAVVTKDIPPNSVAVGVPARVIETLDEYEKKVAKKYMETKHLSPAEKRDVLMKKFNL